LLTSLAYRYGRYIFACLDSPKCFRCFYEKRKWIGNFFLLQSTLTFIQEQGEICLEWCDSTFVYLSKHVMPDFVLTCVKCFCMLEVQSCTADFSRRQRNCTCHLRYFLQLLHTVWWTCPCFFQGWIFIAKLKTHNSEICVNTVYTIFHLCFIYWC
jgi:hypothetical protein